MQNILIVGAGFAGAVYARELAENGYNVDVIDRRDHIAGNAYDERTTNGILVHKYGPHLFHTNNEKVYVWLSKFTEWYHYTHKVIALYQNKRCPLPINRETINHVFNLNLTNRLEALSFIETLRTKIPNAKNAKEVLHNKIGVKLTEIFFEPYTEKMWGMSLTEMEASIVERLNFDLKEEGQYFPNDKYQVMPLNGYTALFQNIFNHPNIRVSLNTIYRKEMSSGYHHTFNSMPIDEYYDFAHGELPYRSIKFTTENGLYTESYTTVNFTDTAKYTRATYWNNLNQNPSLDNNTIRTLEEPCNYKDNNFERYYPVKDIAGDHKKTFLKYLDMANEQDNITFIGRCGTYQYLDMHQVINQSLQGVSKYIGKNTA